MEKQNGGLAPPCKYQLRHPRVSGSESSNPRSQNAGAAARRMGFISFGRIQRMKRFSCAICPVAVTCGPRRLLSRWPN
jgi:hypothetical protein